VTPKKKQPKQKRRRCIAEHLREAQAATRLAADRLESAHQLAGSKSVERIRNLVGLARVLHAELFEELAELGEPSSEDARPSAAGVHPVQPLPGEWSYRKDPEGYVHLYRHGAHVAGPYWWSASKRRVLELRRRPGHPGQRWTLKPEAWPGVLSEAELLSAATEDLRKLHPRKGARS